MKIETAEYFNYQASEIIDFYGYTYEWIDELAFTIPIDESIDSLQPYLQLVKKRFIDLGWEGDGEINLIWIPPFAVAAILQDGALTYEQKYGRELWVENTSGYDISKKSATRGLLLWHVKQLEDGLSFILSPMELNIPHYILY